MTMVIRTLSDEKKSLAARTVSAYAFFYMLGDALINKTPLSNVRMGDGELTLIKDCLAKLDTTEYFDRPITTYPDDKLKKMGIYGITYHDLHRRLLIAGHESTHFAPSVSGLTRDDYDLYSCFDERPHYIDNFYVNIWNDQMKAELYKQAGTVLFIHRSLETADALQINLQKHLGVRVNFLRLSSWDESAAVIDKACNDPAQLVLFSGGPGSKYISPEIADNSGKIVLDIGNAADLWTLSQYKP